MFTSLSLFSILLGPLNAYPWVINGLVEAWVSLKRVQAFLNLEETDPTDYYRTRPSDPSHVVEIKDGCFTWVADGSSTCSAEGSSCLEDTTPRPEQLLCLSLAAGQVGQQLQQWSHHSGHYHWPPLLLILGSVGGRGWEGGVREDLRHSSPHC